MTLRKKTLIIVCLAAVLPLIVLAQIYSAVAASYYDEQAKDSVVACASLTGSSLMLSTDSFIDLSEKIAAHNDIHKYLLGDSSAEQINTVRSELELALSLNSAIKSIYITNAEYNVLISTDIGLVYKTLKPQKRHIKLLSEGKSALLGGSRKTFSAIVPVMNNAGSMIGCVGVVFDSAALSELIPQDSGVDQRFMAILDANSNVIVSSEGYTFNRFGELENISDLNSKIIANDSADDGKAFFYTISGKTRVGYMAHLNSSGWMVFYSSAYSKPQITPIILILICMFSAAAMYVYISKNIFVPLNTLLTGVQRLKDENYSQRLPYIRDGEFDGISSAFNVLLAHIEQDHKELLIKEKRHRIVNELSNSIILEFNIETGTLECSPNGAQLAGYPECFDNFPLPFVKMETVHRDDAELFSNLFNEMLCGRHRGEIDVRLHNINGSYRWYQFLMTTIIDDVTLRPLRIVGKLNDIDDEKRSTDILRYKANRDSLTGIYNKGATHALILERLEMRRDNEHDAMLIMDIDNFKRVNDGYGHQKGDEIISKVAAAISANFRAEDIVGRMGGDEFMVMMCDVNSKEIVRSRTQRLIDTVNEIPLDEEKGDYMGLSIGIALCPQDGEKYDELYSAADNAAYTAKHNGKNGFAFYKED